MKKLWVVTITRSGYVLAESEQEALAELRQIEKWEDPDVTAYESDGNPLGWEDTALVYGVPSADMTFAQALEKTGQA